MTGRLRSLAIALAAISVLAAGGAVLAAASGGDDASEPALEREDRAGDEARQRIDDPDVARRVRAAAIEAAGGGTVAEIEHGDDAGAAYEAEVERPDGSSAEVRLDGRFGVLSVREDD